MKEYNKEEFNSAAYRRSRIAYAAQCTFEYFGTLLVGDAFLAKLLSEIGISDALIGIISSFIYFSFLFQLLSIGLIQKMKSVKRTVIIFDSMSQFLFIGMYCVPFMNADKTVKTIVVMSVVLLAYFFKYMVSSILFKWANSYVEPNKRGSYSAIKEMISLFCGMLFTLAIGFAVDKYESAGSIRTGFLFIVIVLLAINVCSFISLLAIKDGTVTEAADKVDVREIIKNTVGNKNFRNVIILLSMWSIAVSMTVGFMGTFKTSDLLLSVGLIQIINAAANGMRLVFSIPIGRYSDKKSYARGIELALIIAAVGFAANIFTSNKTWWLVIIFTVLYNVSVAGTNANKFNITYSYVRNEYIAQAMAIQNSISGVLGFAASIAGSRILAHIQANGNTLFGIPLYGQQVLSAISLIIICGAIIYDRMVIEKQEIMIQ